MIKQRIKQIFQKHKLTYDWWAETDTMVQIVVENGDWKHDHGRLLNIMKEEGLDYVGRHIPDEENSDDSFTALYLFYLPEE